MNAFVPSDGAIRPINGIPCKRCTRARRRPSQGFRRPGSPSPSSTSPQSRWSYVASLCASLVQRRRWLKSFSVIVIVENATARPVFRYVPSHTIDGWMEEEPAGASGSRARFSVVFIAGWLRLWRPETLRPTPRCATPTFHRSIRRSAPRKKFKWWKDGKTSHHRALILVGLSLGDFGKKEQGRKEFKENETPLMSVMPCLSGGEGGTFICFHLPVFCFSRKGALNDYGACFARSGDYWWNL